MSGQHYNDSNEQTKMIKRSGIGNFLDGERNRRLSIIDDDALTTFILIELQNWKQMVLY